MDGNTFVVNKQGGFLDGLIRDIEDRKDRESIRKNLVEMNVERNEPIRVGFKRLSDSAIIPTKAHASDSGFDLFAAEDVIIEPGETKIIPTGIAVELPAGYEAQVRPRSGVTSKTKLRVQLGTIDNEYTGEIGVIVDCIGHAFNENNSISEYYAKVDGSFSEVPNDDTIFGSYLIRKGDRIAQLVVQELPEVVAVEIEEFTEDSERGEGGFGSSGV